MKIAVIGSGALGCLFGAKFSKKHDVVLLTYAQKEADIINKNGLSVKEEDGSVERFNEHVSACVTGTYEQHVDMVVILVKTLQTENALRQNLKLIGKDTLVLTLQNGLGNFEAISKYVDEKQLVLGTTNHNSVWLSEGNVFHSGSGVTMLGGADGAFDNFQKVKKLFEESGFEAVISDNIGYLLWRKLFVNLTLNSFTYITLTPLGFVSQNQYAMNYVKNVLTEAVSVAQAEGHNFEVDEVVEFVKNVSATHLNGYSSMSQDRKRGIKTEIDWINGAVVKLARKHNISVPYNECIVNMVHAIEDADAYNAAMK